MTEELYDLNEAEIDEGILGAVKVLRAAGVKTFSSCQGGGYPFGHGYSKPTICFDGDEAEGVRAYEVVEAAGFIPFQVARVFYKRGGTWYGDKWEMTFVSGAAHRAPND